jgi:DNA-binding transcriptional ArsR family regulator
MPALSVSQNRQLAPTPSFAGMRLRHFWPPCSRSTASTLSCFIFCAQALGVAHGSASVSTGSTPRSSRSFTKRTRPHAVNPCCILSHMVQHCQARFDASFGALSDATRRGVLEQLGRADASITALAEKFHMTLTGMKKHVGVLEQAGLVTTEKVGRVRTCKLGLRGLQEEAAWIERYRQLWGARFDELDNVVEELKLKEKVDGRTKRK